MKKFVLPIIQTVSTVVLLYWIFSNEQLRRAMGQTFRSADPLWLFIGILVAGVVVLSGITRWRIFLKVQNIPVSWWRTAQLYLIGLFFNLLFLGAIGGDVVKVICLARDHPGRRAAIIMSLVADRMSGLLALITAAAVFPIARYSWFTRTSAASGMLFFLLGYLFFCLMGVVMSFLIAKRGASERIPERMPGRSKFIQLSKAYELIAKSWKQMICAALVSFLGLFAHYGTFYCSGRAFHPSPTLLDMYTVMPVVDVISSLPIAISGLGVREKSFEELLGNLSGIPEETALLISLAGFAVSVVWSMVGAAVFPFYRSETAPRREKIRDLMRETRTLKADESRENIPPQQNLSSVGITKE